MPFDAVRYQKLMDGLEAVEINFREYLKAERFDSSFFLKKYLEIYRTLEGKRFNPLYEVAYVSDGNHLSVAETFSNSDGVRYLRGQDISGDFLIDNNAVFIPVTEYDKLVRSHIFNEDVLLTIVGANTGNTAIVVNASERLTANCKLGIARNNGTISPYYLHVFLASKFGQQQIQRNIRGGGQTGLILPDFRRLLITRLNNDFEEKLDSISRRVYDLLTESQSLYKSAESLLLSELGLSNWQPTEANTEVKTFSQSFAASGRLDAEYYQPKYDEVEDAIVNKAVHYKRISEIKTFNARGLQPEYFEEGNLAVINSKHILDKSLDYGNFEKTEFSYWNKQERARVFKNDILTYTTGANIGRTSTYLIEEKALASNHVNILRIKDEDPVYVAFVMNSILGRLQTEKLSAGSAQQELYPKDIDNFLIPFIDGGVQKEITAAIQRSLDLQNESRHLLEAAKKAVEMAIEAGEEKAMAWLRTTFFF